MAFRIRDVLVSLFGLLFLSPMILLIVVLLFVTQRKVFFRQRRPGLHEKPFWLIKFSTLYDAPPGWYEFERQKERLTPVGKYLRKWSLDELPQLWNVLKGDMSLVGPRPLLMSYLPLYSPEHRKRHEVLPGITGWAQVRGRNALTFTERFEYDVWYVKHKSFGLDLKILLFTVRQVFRTKEVYVDDQTTSNLFDGTN